MLSLRLHVMRLLGMSVERLATETRNRSVRQDDAERLERLGPHEGAIANAQELATLTHDRAMRIRRA